MARDPLIKALVKADERRVIKALHGLPEDERRARAAELIELANQLWDGRTMQVLRRYGRLDDAGANVDRWTGQTHALALALLGTGSLSELRRVGRWPLQPGPLAVDVLLDRRPPWLDKLAQQLLETEEDNWPVVHGLVEAGALARPDTPEYVAGIVRRAPVSLDDAWQVIAYAGETTSQRAAEDQGAGWREAIVAGTRDGKLPRKRVLDATLDALSRDITAYRASWHTALWKELKPTANERTARIPHLRTLLASAAEPVVGFAVDELNRAKAEVEGAELTGALAAPAKKTVRAALKLLDRRPDAAAATIALGHEAADVQKAALDRLERWELTDEARDALLRNLDLLAATQRPRAEALLGLALPAVDEPAPTIDIAGIPEHIRTALNFGGPVPEAPVPGEPVLGEPIKPIETREELADVLSSALSATWIPQDERLLDGMLRLCDQPFDGPLKRIGPRLAAWGSLRPTVAGVAHAWMTRTALPRPDDPTIWELRALAVAERVARGETGTLLALPTHQGGWIDPTTFAERLNNGPVDQLEHAQARLRLATGADTSGPRLSVRVIGSEEHPQYRLRIERDPADELGDGPIGEQIAGTAPHEFRHKAELPDPIGWPARRDVVCAAVISRIGWNLVSGGGPYDSHAARVLEILLGPREPLPPLALQLATLALCSNQEREHLLAADLLIAGIDDGRIDAGNLAPGLRELLPVLLTNRLRPRLATVAAAGPLHRAVVRDMLEGLLDRLQDLPARRRNPLLRLLEELRAEGGRPDAERDLLLAARVSRARRWMHA